MLLFFILTYVLNLSYQKYFQLKQCDLNAFSSGGFAGINIGEDNRLYVNPKVKIYENHTLNASFLDFYHMSVTFCILFQFIIPSHFSFYSIELDLVSLLLTGFSLPNYVDRHKQRISQFYINVSTYIMLKKVTIKLTNDSNYSKTKNI